MTHTIKFSLAFTSQVDSLLKDVYSRKLQREKFFLFLELIERQSCSYTNKDIRYERARLKAEYIKHLLGRNYVDIVSALLDHNIIETDNQYIVGEKSKDYWIADSFMTKIELEDIYTMEEIIINDFNTYVKLEKEYKLNKEKFPELLDTLDSIEFDYSAALNWFANLDTNTYFIKSDGSFNTNKFNCYYRMINDINEKKWIIVEDEKTGRIFNTFNLVKRELREFCYINGEQLVCSDLKSSQPYFLASYLLKLYPVNSEVIRLFDVIKNDDIYNYCLTRYTELKGDNLYNEYCSKELKMITKAITNRNDSKVQFVKLLFKGNKGSAAFEIVFKNDFPFIYNAIKELKKENKNELAIQLQSTESDVFISTYKHLSKNGIDCLPVHDSIYVKKSDYDVMLKTLKNEFDKQGFKDYKLM